MSLILGTITSSPSRRARRSALETAFSNTVIGSRWDTPLRRSTRLSSRASNAIRSMTSAMKSGITTGRSSPRSIHASCAVIAMPSSTVRG
jgi:hypothetical protein